jgi:hypothetical protein
MGLRGGPSCPRVLIVLVVGGALAVASGSSGAASQEVYAIADVAVDVTAETAAAARSQARFEGARRALGRLLRRITLKADYSRHPTLGDNDIATLVQDMVVQKERLSSTRYIANLIFRFKQEDVRRLLRREGIPFSETYSKPVLVLPVYGAAGAEFLWDEPNPWRAAWNRHFVMSDGLLPLVLPAGDLVDVGVIGPTQALAGDGARLGEISARYGVEDTLVAHATLAVDFANDGPRLDITLKRFGRTGDSVIVDSLAGSAAEGAETLLAAGVARVVERLGERWKHDTVLRFGDEARLSVAVPIHDLAEWLDIRRRLRAVSVVSRVELGELSRVRAQIIVHYLGAPGQLVLSLAQNDLDLTQDGGFWTLRLGGAAADARTEGGTEIR